MELTQTSDHTDPRVRRFIISLYGSEGESNTIEETLEQKFGSKNFSVKKTDHRDGVMSCSIYFNYAKRLSRVRLELGERFCIEVDPDRSRSSSRRTLTSQSTEEFFLEEPPKENFKEVPEYQELKTLKGTPFVKKVVSCIYKKRFSLFELKEYILSDNAGDELFNTFVDEYENINKALKALNITPEIFSNFFEEEN